MYFQALAVKAIQDSRYGKILYSLIRDFGRLQPLRVSACLGFHIVLNNYARHTQYHMKTKQSSECICNIPPCFRMDDQNFFIWCCTPKRLTEGK